MRNLFTLLFLVIATNIFADGGGDQENKRVVVDCYEPNLNLRYIGMIDTIKVPDGKSKFAKSFVTSNVAVFDIKKNSANYIFKDSVKRVILDFRFESEYLSENKVMEFNNLYEPNEAYMNYIYTSSNNKNVAYRQISNNLIVVTQDPAGRNIEVWTCDKHGSNLKKELEVGKDWEWEIDVKNQLFRVTRQRNLKLEVKSFQY